MVAITKSVISLLLTAFMIVVLLLTPAELARTRVCGQKLINILKKLCRHRYRTPAPTAYTTFTGFRGYRSSAPDYPREGIVASCCHKKCTYSYLKSFCAAPEKPMAPTATAPRMRTTRAIRQHESGKAGQNQEMDSPVKTFRSLFHLLHTIGDILKQGLPNNSRTTENEESLGTRKTTNQFPSTTPGPKFAMREIP